MTLEKSPQEPNAPICLESITISHINGHPLPESCTARVILHLSPTIMATMESDEFPVGIIDSRLEMPFVVTVRDKGDIKVVRSRLSMPGSAKGTVKGALGLYKSPLIVSRPDAMVSSISFCALNFSKFSGRKTELVDSKYLPATELLHENLKVCLIEASNLSENENILGETGGYGVTHTGVIEHSNGQAISVSKAETILRGVRAFLSFARGAGCGLILVRANYTDGRQGLLEWGSSQIDPWNSAADTWLPTMVDGSENLSQAFPGFWELVSDTHWRHPLLRIVDLYINSKNGPFHIGIILVQTALETLCNQIFGPKKKNVHIGDFISQSIKCLGFPVAIPSSCAGLADFFQNCPRVDGDGPRAIVELRNDLVHAKKRHDDDAEAQIDALRLGQWYIELILLKKFKYLGRYKNRLAKSEMSPFETVPWDQDDI